MIIWLIAKIFLMQSVSIHMILGKNRSGKNRKISDLEICRSISLKPRTLVAPNTLFLIYFSKSCKLKNFPTKSDFKFENWKFLLKFTLLGCYSSWKVFCWKFARLKAQNSKYSQIFELVEEVENFPIPRNRVNLVDFVFTGWKNRKNLRLWSFLPISLNFAH